MLSTPSLEGRIALLGAAQHAVFDIEQLEAIGLAPNAVRHRLAAGRLHRRYRRVYSLVPEGLLTVNGRWMAAVLACGPSASLSLRDAAMLQGLRRSGRRRIDVTVAGTTHRTHPGVDLHRSVTLSPQDVEIVDGIPCTTVARTLFDLGEVIPRREHERAFDQAEALGVLDLRAIDDQLARNPTRRGAPRIRAILREHRIGSTVTESDFEEALIPPLRATGAPMPEVGAWIDPGDGELMVKRDFVWREFKVDVETDGGHHRTRRQMEIDTRNDQRLIDAGWTVIRITWKQLEEEPERVLATILRALRRAGASW